MNLSDVHVGDELPELGIDITATTVIAGAIASRDFTPVHHDRAAAQSQGLGDVIMNTATTNGFVSRYVTDWTGPDAVIKRITLKLGAPNCPGEMMKMKGKVKTKDEREGVVAVEVVGTNSWGDHVTATVTVALPRGA